MYSNVATRGRPFDALCIGESMVLLTPVSASPLAETDTLQLAVAGAESNVAQYLVDLGHRVQWFSRLGADALGERVRRTIDQSGVGTDHIIIDTEHQTGVMFKDPDPCKSQVHYYRNNSAAAHLSENDLNQIQFDEYRLVHATGVTSALSQTSREMQRELQHRTRVAGATFSFDVNYRASLWPRSEAAPELLSLAQAADIVFVGRDEAESLWGTPNVASIRALIGAHNHLVVKDGEVGATAISSDEARGTFVPSPTIEVVEPTGAGDAFAAGYISGFLKDAEVSSRLHLGHRVATRALASTSDYVRHTTSKTFGTQP